jgi:hypothetical protein
MRTRHITALAAATIALPALTACGSSSSKPLDQGAAVMCEEFVKERLKSPGSAKFSDVFDTKIKTLSDKKPWKYKVTGYVDSQNSFGASVRNNYVCTISTKDDKNWTLDDLDMTRN